MSNNCFIVRLFPVFLMERKFSEYSFPMKTDACNVEDINIHHIKACVLLSCVASFEDWSNIFRTRSFTLCKNDLDKSVRVLCEQTGWLLINKSWEDTSRQYFILSSLMNKRPLQVSPFLDAAQSTSSEVCDFHVWFSRAFVMQYRQTRQDSFRCIARPNSSSASILLWLLLDLHLFAFFLTLPQNNW